jgi:gas vesicle protein
MSDKWNIEQEPTVEIDNSSLGGEILSHPAFGQISAGRVSGHANLYGSDFTHQHFIEISIRTSQLRRSLSNDWPHNRDELISVWISEAQWASFVSTLNSGMGQQCTIRHIGLKPMPKLPSPKSRSDQFSKEARQTTEKASQELKELGELIQASTLSGAKKKELLRKINQASSAIGGSVKFVLDQFGEHMESTTEKAKIEIEAYIQNRIQRAGLDALISDNRPIELIDKR